MFLNVLRRNFKDYLQEFMHDSSSIGILLLVCTGISLLLANLSFGAGYLAEINRDWPLMHALHLPHSPLHFINDGFMAVFFFLVGMEIKRELTGGELRSLRQAILPVGAAMGGMIVPAIIYLFINKGGQYHQGWGIPMATDIAFSLGVASMLGRRFPLGLKIFLTALAIIDDLGAIVVIAFFYGSSINGWYFMAAVACVGLIFALNKLKVGFGIFQFAVGLLLWYCVFNSGIHATIAGVVFAFMVPASQLTKWEHRFHNLVNFLILPLFALANTAIIIHGNFGAGIFGSLSIGIFLGLVAGKPIGVLLASWLMVKNKIAELPAGVSWSQMLGAGLLAGIGFTMSIFIACLAFTDAATQDLAKISILIASACAMASGYAWISLADRKSIETGR